MGTDYLSRFDGKFSTILVLCNSVLVVNCLYLIILFVEFQLLVTVVMRIRTVKI